jgi:hypothetical protein
VALYGYAPESMALAFGIYELLVQYCGKDLANSKRSTPLSESTKSDSLLCLLFGDNTVVNELCTRKIRPSSVRSR